MKTMLTERTEMAKAMNFGKYPVLSIDLDNRPYEDSHFTKGGECRVAWDSKDARYAGMASHCELVLSNGKYELTGGGCCISASYNLDDFLTNVRQANTPLVHKGEVVAVAHYSKDLNISFVRLMRVSEHMDQHCIVVATLEPITE